jgi:hypothetical protein
MLVFSKIKYLGISLFFAAGVTVVSCKSNYAVLSIENTQHAPDELPQAIQSVTLMNRSMTSQFQNFKEDSLQMYYYRNGFQLSKIVLDSMACDTTLKALSGLMFESGRYDVVIPVNRNLERKVSYDMLPDTLNSNQVSEICRNYNTDALIVMERFLTKPMTDISEETRFDPYAGYVKSYNATLDLKYDAFFRVYQPGRKALVKEIAVSDTIYWESSDTKLDQLLSKLPTVKKAMINGAIKVALDLDSKISPTWVPEKRGYFLFRPKDDLGEKYMKENKLDEAARFWGEMEKSTNKNIRSKAEYNLALLNELNGDIDRAIEYGLKSFHTYYRFQTETYLKKLEARRQALQKLR